MAGSHHGLGTDTIQFANGLVEVQAGQSGAGKSERIVFEKPPPPITMKQPGLCRWSFRVSQGGLLLWGLLFLFLVAKASPPPGYSLIWADEFNGTSLISTNWGYRYLGPRNDAVNVTNAVAVTNGALVITTYTENGTNYTGMIGTSGKYAPRYGYLEASIRWGDAPGGWSAFWMQADTMGNVGNPHTNGTEIDIVEHRARDSNNANISNQSVANLHWDGYGANEQSVGTGLVGSGLASGFHTYALEWTPAIQRFYTDGVALYSVTNSTALDPLAPAVAVSQTSEYIILSSEVHNANWAGTIPTGGYGSLATSTTKMTVDYLRVYQLTVPVAPANITGTLLSGGKLVLTGTNLNGGQNFHYVVLSSTNATLPLANWKLLSTNSFSPDGTFHYTNTLVSTLRAMFYEVKAVP